MQCVVWSEFFVLTLWCPKREQRVLSSLQTLLIPTNPIQQME